VLEYVRMAKLTLTVDEQVIAKAKEHAAARGTSISALVEEYLNFIVNPPKPDSPTPILDQWCGVLEGAYPDAESAIDDYHRYLEEKYK
jgi:hypothetical protein